MKKTFCSGHLHFVKRRFILKWLVSGIPAAGLKGLRRDWFWTVLSAEETDMRDSRIRCVFFNIRDRWDHLLGARTPLLTAAVLVFAVSSGAEPAF